MPLTRVYLSLTAADLDALAGGDSLGRPPVPAHAVTPLVGRPGLTTDEEELEHLAWVAATEEAARLTPPGVRRVVAAADVETEDVLHPPSPDAPSRVELTQPVIPRVWYPGDGPVSDDSITYYAVRCWPGCHDPNSAPRPQHY